MKATVNMTDKQVVNACKPKPVYYSNTYGRCQARPCLLCGKTIKGTLADLENDVKGSDLPKYRREVEIGIDTLARP